MKSICRRLTALLLIFLAPFAVQAQNNFFTDIPESVCRAGNHKRVIVPEKYRTLRLDGTALADFLRLLPLESTLANRSFAPVITLPMPDGSSARFRVWESPAMDPVLSAKFPEIKSYTGQGIDDPTANLKLDLSPLGFRAMVLSAVTGSYFVDPYDQVSTNNYISYFKSDFKKPGTFRELPVIRTNRKNRQGISPDGVLAGVCTAGQLRTYRLAVACTNEYAIAATGQASPTVAQALATINTTVNRVNGVYEKELSFRLVLVANNNLIVFTNAATDPFTGNNSPGVLIGESQTVIDTRIGSANYDIGHTFSTGGGGLASLGVVCQAGQKASGITGTDVPVGDPYDIDYVAHEMGHQFGAEHTFNSTNGFCGGNNSPLSNSEPGGGSTIMAYAGLCAPDDLQNNSDPYFNGVSFDEITDYAVTGPGNSCPVTTNNGNSAPVVNSGGNYSIPLNTPFVLTGSATDANNDALTYCWEQVDVGGPFGSPGSPTGDAPIFRSFLPVNTPVRFFPRYSSVLNNTSTIGEKLPSYGRVMKFRLTARDNRAGGGGVCRAEATITAVGGTGPFEITAPNTAVVWTAGDFQTVTWNTSGTQFAPINCTSVIIELSTDGGTTFPTTLIASTTNDGSEEIVVPNVVTTTARIRIRGLNNVFYDISNTNFRINAATASTFNFNSPAPVNVCGGVSGNATLKTVSLNGFTTPINLTASAIPTGATVSFSVNPLTPGNSTVVTLGNLGALAPGTYTIRITGVAGSVTKTRDINYVVGSGGTPPQSLIAPANDAIGQNVKPTFNWSTVAGATSYTLEISTSLSFSPLTQTIPNIFSLPYVLNTPLQENTVYYWRVKTTNSCGTGTASASGRFKTGLNSCRISTDVPKVISAAAANTITSTLVIPASLGATITDLNVVGLDITHSWISDLTVRLRSPAGTTVTLFDQICTDQADIFMNLDDQAVITTFPCPPVGGVTVKPANPLSVFNGQSSTGTWTLTVVDNAAQDGGSLNGWGLSINNNSNTCTFTPTPLATTYTFTGNGNWNVASNWSGNTVPPSVLPAGESIVINHIAGGNCVLNVTQTISAGANLTVVTGKNMLVQGNLNIQ